jgi:Xaa-Pro dipeptidase
MRRAARLADEGITAAVEAIRQRKTEIEVAMAGEQAMRALLVREYPDHEAAGFAGGEGAIWTGLWCWVQSGPRIRLNDTPKAVRINDGTIALPQTWGVLDGYTAENERTVGVEPVSREVKRTLEMVVEAREAAFTAVRPGATCAEVFEAAAAVFRRAGYERHLPGRIGHSIGLGPHEHLSLAPEEHLALVPGMAFTIEPGVHIPEGGVRHSDTIVVTNDGHEALTQTPRGVLLV